MYLKRIPLAEGHPTATWAKRFKDRFGWRTKRSELPLPIWIAGCANYTASFYSLGWALVVAARRGSKDSRRRWPPSGRTNR
eukprot:3016488-Pyramimonas_sp.AAC.1